MIYMFDKAVIFKEFSEVTRMLLFPLPPRPPTQNKHSLGQNMKYRK